MKIEEVIPKRSILRLNNYNIRAKTLFAEGEQKKQKTTFNEFQTVLWGCNLATLANFSLIQKLEKIFIKSVLGEQVLMQIKNAVLDHSSTAFFEAIIELSSGLFEHPDEIQQNDGTDHGGHQRADEAVGRQPDHAEQPAAEQRADDAADEIADQAHAALFHELSGKPTGGEADEQKPNQTIHFPASFKLRKSESRKRDFDLVSDKVEKNRAKVNY